MAKVTDNATTYTAITMGDVDVTTNAVSGDFGLDGQLTINSLDINKVSAGDRLDWTTAFDFDGDGQHDLLNPGADLPTPADLTINLTGDLQHLSLIHI